MRPRFGTDGVRGVANVELTPEYALDLGRVAARLLAGGDTILVGRDTRLSGPMLVAAFSAGAAAEGVEVVDLGVLPTPGVAFLAGVHGAPAAVVSASHNPFADNGIKLFARGGVKLGADTESAIEAALDALAAPDRADEQASVPQGDGVGGITSAGHLSQLYSGHLMTALEDRDLHGMRIVLDCGHGAASAFAGPVFTAVGADVTVLNHHPDGTNINAGCGSTDTSGLRQAVVDRRADLGLAFDGDADRVIAIDADGNPVDGDEVIAICALDLRRRGRLRGNTVVVTVMTNLGFRLAMQDEGIEVVETPVGDRHVLEALAEGGWSIGGEQSGHIIFPDLATTGDGMLSGLLLADAVKRSGQPLGALAADAMTRLPQVLRNVRVGERRPDIAERVTDDIEAVAAALGRNGRVLVRPSGTEPVVRVMVEAPTEEAAAEAAERLAAAVERASGPEAPR